MCSPTVSCWQKASTIATYLQVIAVTVSLLLIRSQLQQQKSQLGQQTVQLEQQLKLSRASNTQSLVNLLTPLNLRVTDRAMAELWVKGGDGIKKVANVKQREVQTEQYETLIASYMVFYENAYSQYRAGLLDEEIYQGWDKDLAGFIEQHHLANYWKDWGPLYRADFAKHVEEIIAAQTPVPSPK